MNLYGVYLVYFSLLVVLYIHFLNACLCFAIDLSFWMNMAVLVSFFAICPFLRNGHFCARKGLGLSVPRNMGPSVPRNMGPSVPRNMGPSVPTSTGPSMPSFHGIASSFKVSNSL